MDATTFRAKYALSRRETQVALEIASGDTNRAIAERLFITEKSIKFHLTNVYRKMQLKNRSQLLLVLVAEKMATIPTVSEVLPEAPRLEVVRTPLPMGV